MYEITSGGELVALVAKPRYVKLNADGIYVEATAEDAIGISVAGTLYNLPGSTAIEGAPEAMIREGDASEYIFTNRTRILQNEESTTAAIVGVEDAVCELDESTEQRMSAIEDAVCELDEIINGGGDK